MGKVEIIDLNDFNVGHLAKRLDNSNPLFVAYLADWCGHCQHFKPQWEMVKQELINNPHNNEGMVVTCDDKLMQQLPLKQPSGFPTMSLYKGTKHIQDYSGMRDKDSVLNFIRQNLKSSKKKQKIRKSRKMKKIRKSQKMKKIRKSRKVKKSRKSRKVKKSRKSRKVKKSRKSINRIKKTQRKKQGGEKIKGLEKLLIKKPKDEISPLERKNEDENLTVNERKEFQDMVNKNQSDFEDTYGSESESD